MAKGPYYPVGRYKGEIIEQALSETDKGVSFVALKVRIDGRPEFEDYERTIKLYITDKSVVYTVEKLKALGYDRATWKDIDPATNDYFSFLGIEAPLYCKHEAGQDGTGMYEKWDISTPRAGKTLEPIIPAKLRQLDMLFGKALSGSTVAAKPRTGKPVLVGGGDGVEISDDDIPF